MIDIDGNLEALRQRMIQEEEHDARIKPCPECDGTGTVTYEKPVSDKVNGGFLEEFEDDCGNCGGSGEVEDWQDEDEIDY